MKFIKPAAVGDIRFLKTDFGDIVNFFLIFKY